MKANNETGTVEQVNELSAIAHEHGAIFFSDITQAAGKIATDVINITSRTVTFTSLYIPAGGSITFYVYYTNTNTHGGSTVTTLPSDFTSLSVSIVHTSACTK